MTKFFAIRKSTWIAFFVSILASFLMAVVTHAQSSEEQVAAKYGVKFPVAELGNCNSITECRNFCEDPVNQTVCIAFAKKKGFYKEPEVATGKKEEIIAAAKAELGCDSESSCRSFCSDQANFDKCDVFAKKRGLSGGQVEDLAKGKILEKAKEILGCSSPDSCAAFCSDEANRQRCSEFAKSTGLRGGEQRTGPGGCSSEETCKAFCSDPGNFQVCRGFSESSGGKFSGPGGCSSEQSCKDYCKSNPDSCRNFAAQSSGGDTYRRYCDENPDKCRQDQGEQKREFEKFCLQNPDKCKEVEDESRRGEYNPEQMCARSPNCKWEENTCKCGFYEGARPDDGKKAEEYARYCRENPAKCGQGQPGGSNAVREKEEFGDYCRKNPQKCAPQGNSGGSYSGNNMSRENQESTCKAGGGSCDWSSGVCNCRGYRSSGASGGSTNGGPGSGAPDPATGCRNAGGSWNGSSCQMPTYNSTTSTSTQNTAPSGMNRESQEAGCRSCGGSCNWNGDFCNCQCGSSGSSGGSAPAPAPVQNTAPAPQPEQQSQPAPQPEQQSQPAPVAPPATEPAPAPAVQGIAVVRSIFDRIFDIFR